MKAVVVNYNHDPQNWWLDYCIKAENTWLYDRSDDGIQRTFDAKTFRTANVGNVDYDKIGWLVENYYDLPEVFFWGKSNIFKYVSPEALRAAIQKGEFTPLCHTEHAGTIDQFGVVSYMQDGLYWERNDGIGWYTKTLATNCNWGEWCKHFGITAGAYIPFPPGGNFILTKERIQRYGVDFYREMRDALPYVALPAEAHMAERSYYLLWK